MIKKRYGKEINYNGIIINVISESIYMDYTIYNIQIENKTKSNINIANLQKVDTLYIQDSNNIQYYAYLNELTDEMVNIPQNMKIDFHIKFMIKANSNNKITEMCFNNILKDNNYEKINIPF